MPFVEIGRNQELWIRIKRPQTISFSKYINDLLSQSGHKKVKLLYDKENKLFALKPSDEGYTYFTQALTCRRIPPDVPDGKFLAENKDYMFIIDLTKPLS